MMRDFDIQKRKEQLSKVYQNRALSVALSLFRNTETKLLNNNINKCRNLLTLMKLYLEYIIIKNKLESVHMDMDWSLYARGEYDYEKEIFSKNLRKINFLLNHLTVKKEWNKITHKEYESKSKRLIKRKKRFEKSLATAIKNIEKFERKYNKLEKEANNLKAELFRINCERFNLKNIK